MSVTRDIRVAIEVDGKGNFTESTYLALRPVMRAILHRTMHSAVEVPEVVLADAEEIRVHLRDLSTAHLDRSEEGSETHRLAQRALLLLGRTTATDLATIMASVYILVSRIERELDIRISEESSVSLILHGLDSSFGEQRTH